MKEDGTIVCAPVLAVFVIDTYSDDVLSKVVDTLGILSVLIDV